MKNNQDKKAASKSCENMIQLSYTDNQAEDMHVQNTMKNHLSLLILVIEYHLTSMRTRQEKRMQ